MDGYGGDGLSTPTASGAGGRQRQSFRKRRAPREGRSGALAAARWQRGAEEREVGSRESRGWAGGGGGEGANVRKRLVGGGETYRHTRARARERDEERACA